LKEEGKGEERKYRRFCSLGKTDGRNSDRFSHWWIRFSSEKDERRKFRFEMRTETVNLNTGGCFTSFSNLLWEDSKWIIRWTLC